MRTGTQQQQYTDRKLLLLLQCYTTLVLPTGLRFFVSSCLSPPWIFNPAFVLFCLRPLSPQLTLSGDPKCCSAPRSCVSIVFFFLCKTESHPKISQNVERTVPLRLGPTGSLLVFTAFQLFLLKTHLEAVHLCAVVKKSCVCSITIKHCLKSARWKHRSSSVSAFRFLLRLQQLLTARFQFHTCVLWLQIYDYCAQSICMWCSYVFQSNISDTFILNLKIICNVIYHRYLNHFSSNLNME